MHFPFFNAFVNCDMNLFSDIDIHLTNISRALKY